VCKAVFQTANAEEGIKEKPTMAKVMVDDYEFEIPDDQAVTGKEIKKAASEKAKEPVDGVPYVRRGNTDLVIKDDEALVPRRMIEPVSLELSRQHK
jgi:hypothetical protein